MISPDTAAAVDVLEENGVLSREQAALFGRVARGELVSISLILHALLYAGVLAITGGVGLIVREHVTDLGPAAIAVLIGAAAFGCLAWIARVAPPFSPQAAPSPHIAFDYVLLLGALLFATDLAYCEWRFTPLGDSWAWHLLLVSLLYAGLALRFDSRVLFALSLTTFAAWRGTASISVEGALFGWAASSLAVRVNGLACGLLFLGLGRWLIHGHFKPHFEPVATFVGWALLLTSAAGGTATGGGPDLWLSRIELLALGLTLARLSWAADRFALFVMGVLAAYLGFLTITLQWVDSGAASALYTAVSAVLLLFLLLRAHRRRPVEAS